MTGSSECPEKKSGEREPARRGWGSVRPVLTVGPGREEGAGSQASSALTCAHQPEPRAQKPEPEPGPSELLRYSPGPPPAQANGSAMWGETSFFLSYGDFKLKKIPKQPRAPCAVESHTPPPASSALIASPQPAAAGAKNQSQPSERGAGRQRLRPGQSRSLALLGKR